MANYNIKLALTKLPGAKVMDIQGKTQTRRCVVIPIDNDKGAVQDEYIGKGPDGMPERKYMRDVQLNLTAFSFAEARYGHTHGVKISFNSETIEKMTENDLYSIPIIGNMTPWSVKGKKEDDDLPPAEDPEKDW